MDLLNIFERSRAKAVSALDHEFVYDGVVLLHIHSKGWILDKIGKLIVSQLPGKWAFVYSERTDTFTDGFPKARNYLFMHFKLAITAMRKEQNCWAGRRFVWYTHFDPDRGISMQDLSVCMSNITHIFTPCAHNKEFLKLIGVHQPTSVILGGADPDMFKPHERGGGTIGMVGAHYPRKRPELFLELVKRMPEHKFLIVAPVKSDIKNKGLYWENFEAFDELASQPNFELLELPYEKYPEAYARMDVYISLSWLEGGPIALIEALMSNVVPVVSNTGFASDLITKGQNGYVFPVDAEVDVVANLIRMAMRLETEVFKDSHKLSWSSFAQQIAALMFPKLYINEPISMENFDSALSIRLHGWFAPEARGSWSRSSGCSIELPPLADARQEDVFYLKLRAWSPIPAGQDHLTCEVFFNHSLHKQLVVSDDMPSDYIIMLAGLDLSQPNVVSFNYPQLNVTETIETVISEVYKLPTDVKKELDEATKAVRPNHDYSTISERNFGLKFNSFRVHKVASLEFKNGTAEVASKQLANYLLGAWHPAEARGAWSSGPTSLLAFQVNPSCLDKKFKVSILVNGLKSKKHALDQSIAIRINGLETKALLLNRNKHVEHTFLLNNDYIAKSNGLISLEFVSSHIYRPSDYGISKDSRNLGFKLIKFSVIIRN